MSRHTASNRDRHPQAIIDQRLQGKRPGSQINISIGGGSGSGKSTIAKMIQERLEPHCPVTVVGLDRFFKPVADLPTYDSAYHQSRRPDFNRPDSLRVDDMVAYCASLSGNTVFIFEGHLALCYAPLRQLMDLKCFVDIDLSQMLERRTNRNLAKGYGGDAETIWHYNRECVAPQYQRYILPSKVHADLVIPNHSTALAARDAMLAMLCQKIHTVKGCC